MLRPASRFIRQTRTGTVVAQRRNTRATMSFPRRSQRHSASFRHSVIQKGGNPGKETVHGETVSRNGKEPVTTWAEQGDTGWRVRQNLRLAGC